MRVLVVEDNAKLAANIVDYLEARGFAADCAADGLTALHLAATERFDALLLDLALPGLDGMEVCRKLRQARDATPIIVLTAKGELQDKLTGLSTGADDYLVKPVALAELEARIRSQVRRAQGGLDHPRLQVEDLCLDEATLEVYRSGHRLTLNGLDLELLKVLMRDSPKVVPRRRLETEIWGEEPPEADTLRAHIHRLRRVVDRPFATPLIHTVHGIGYRLVGPDALPA